MPNRLPPSLQLLEAEQTVICAHLAPAMQRLVDALGAGYTHAVQGSLSLTKAAALVAKFQTRYPGLARDRKHAYRQHKAGKARYKLIGFANRSGSEFLFFLLTDQPDHVEQWADITEKTSRLTLYQYEAVRLTKADAGLVWTWQITRAAYDKGLALMRAAVRTKQLDLLQHMIDRTRTWPGFSRIRVQREELRRAVMGDWKRTMREDSTPEWPRLRYLQRIRTR